MRLAAAAWMLWILVYADAESPGTALRPGVREQARLAGGAPVRFTVALSAGEAAWITVGQGESDLRIKVSYPDGSQVAVRDEFERGRESVTILAKQTGDYTAEISPVTPATGPVSFSIEAVIHKSGPDDELRSAAEWEASEAKRLYSEGTSESRNRAVKYRLESLAKWAQFADQFAIAATHAAAGDALHRISQFDQANDHYRVALEGFRTEGDRRGEGEVLNNLGLTHWQTGELKAAREYFGEAGAVWQELRFDYGEAAVLTNRGLLEWEAGDFSAALDDHVRAAKLFEQLRSDAGRAFALNNAAVALESLGDPAGARENLLKAIPLFRSAKNALAEGRARVRLARIELHEGRSATALRVAQEAELMLRSSGDRVAEAEGLMVLGEIQSRLRKRTQAAQYYEEALQGFREAGRPKGIVDALLARGGELRAAGRIENSRLAFGEAVQLADRSGFLDLEGEALRQLAMVERQSGEPAKAAQHLTNAMELAEQLRRRAPQGALRISWFAARQPLYLESLDLLNARYRRGHDAGVAAEAFEVSERMRARGLLEELAAERAATSGAINPALARRERELRAQMNFWYGRMEKSSESRGQPARERFERARAEYRDVESEIQRALLPGGVADTEPVTLPEVQSEGLDEGVLLLSYVSGRARSYLWAVTKREIRMFELPAGSVIDAAAAKLLRALSVRPTMAGDEGYRAPAAEVGRMLLGPAAGLMSGRKLAIIESGLSQIPFAVLPDPVSGQFLIREHDITILPSASMLVRSRRMAGSRRRPSRSLAMFADPVYTLDDPRIPAVKSDAAREEGFPRLAYSRLAAEAVLPLAPPDALLLSGFGASLEAFRAERIRQFRYLHFATHGTLDPAHPEMSSVVLSLRSQDGERQEGHLRTGEVLSHPLAAELVFLDTCHSAGGQYVPGEGLEGLTSSFLAGGRCACPATCGR